MQSGSALWLKKAPSVVSSCNSKKNPITVSTWEAPFNKGLGSQKHVNMNGTIIFFHTMIRLIFLPWECNPWCSLFVQLTNTTIVVNGKPLTWISSVLLLLLRPYGQNGVMFPSCHHLKKCFSTFYVLNEKFSETQVNSFVYLSLCSCL